MFWHLNLFSLGDCSGRAHVCLLLFGVFTHSDTVLVISVFISRQHVIAWQFRKCQKRSSWGEKGNRKAYCAFSIKWDILYIKYISSIFYLIGLQLKWISMGTDACPPTLPDCFFTWKGMILQKESIINTFTYTLIFWIDWWGEGGYGQSVFHVFWKYCSDINCNVIIMYKIALLNFIITI